MNVIAKLFKVSPVNVSKWDSFFDSKRKKKITKRIKNFLLSKAKNNFIGIDNENSRKLAILIEKNLKLRFHLLQLTICSEVY